ncbi:MAG: cation:proton antiporter subunit C, partial [Amphiplicatus sp.]
MDLDFVIDHYNYWIFIVLMMTGLYIVIARGNLVKKIVGLNIFQTSVFIYYISIGKITGGTAPILIGGHGGGHGDEHAEDAAHAAPHEAHDGPDALHDAPAQDLNDALESAPHGAFEEGGHGEDALHAAPQSLPDGAETNSFAVEPPHTGDEIVAAPPPTG